MNRTRTTAIGKLILLFGTPLVLLLGLFSTGVYYGVQHRASILSFERDWLGMDVTVPEPSSELESDEVTVSSEPSSDEPVDPNPHGSVERPTEGTPVITGPDAVGGTPDKPPEQVGGVPAPLGPLEPKVDPLDSEQNQRLAVPVVVQVKVLVDPLVIAQQPDWIDYVQRTVSRASYIYEQQFGVRLVLGAVGRWSVPPDGMGADALLRDLKEHPREGTDLMIGLTGRPFDSSASGTTETPSDQSPFNGSYGVVYATPGHREAHLRTFLHEVSHMFGAKDIVDPQHPGWIAGSWMSYAPVLQTQAPWIDPVNRQRILARKDRPFSPEGARFIAEPPSGRPQEVR